MNCFFYNKDFVFAFRSCAHFEMIVVNCRVDVTEIGELVDDCSHVVLARVERLCNAFHVGAVLTLGRLNQRNHLEIIIKTLSSRKKKRKTQQRRQQKELEQQSAPDLASNCSSSATSAHNQRHRRKSARPIKHIIVCKYIYIYIIF